MRHEVRPHGLAFLLLSRWDELVCFCPLCSAWVEEIVASWDGDRLGRFSFPWLLPLFLFVCVCVCAVCVSQLFSCAGYSSGEFAFLAQQKFIRYVR